MDPKRRAQQKTVLGTKCSTLGMGHSGWPSGASRVAARLGAPAAPSCATAQVAERARRKPRAARSRWHRDRPFFRAAGRAAGAG